MANTNDLTPTQDRDEVTKETYLVYPAGAYPADFASAKERAGYDACRRKDGENAILWMRWLMDAQVAFLISYQTEFADKLDLTDDEILDMSELKMERLVRENDIPVSNPASALLPEAEHRARTEIIGKTVLLAAKLPEADSIIRACSNPTYKRRFISVVNSTYATKLAGWTI
jgi:hypothetical protein